VYNEERNPTLKTNARKQKLIWRRCAT